MAVEMAETSPRKVTRNPEASRARILEAARNEFVAHGLSGARVDRIAHDSGVNKNLIYHYFGSKDALYLSVLEGIYAGLRQRQRDEDLRELPPVEGIRRLVESTFDHFVATPELIRLMSVENIHFGRYLKRSRSIKPLYGGLLDTIQILLKRGQAAGTFRRDVDAIDLYLSISGLAYFFLSNQHTLGWLLDRDLLARGRVNKRRQHVADVVLGYLLSSPLSGWLQGDLMVKSPNLSAKKVLKEKVVSATSSSKNVSGPTRRTLLGVAIAAPFVLRGGRALAAEALSVRVDFAPWGVQSALHLSVAKGWFKDDGLDIDLQDGTGSLNTINLVAAGNVDVGLVQLGLLAIARSKGLPVTSFAGFLRKGDLATLVDAKSGPKTAKELAGRKIVCFAASPWAPFIDVYLKRIGLERGEGADKVNVVMVSPAAMVPTYASGGADGFMSLKEFGEPYVAKERPARSILAEEAGIAFPSYGLIASDETLKKRKDLLGKLVANQSKSWQYIFSDPAHIDEGAKAIMANRADKQLNFDILRGQTALCKEFFDTENTKGKPMGWQSPDDWKQTVAMMSEAGQAKADANINEFYTNDLIRS